MHNPIEGQIAQRIAEVRQRLADLRARLPVHSTSPAMMMEMEELEEELERLLRTARERDP
jgi:hypothetical protein